MCGNQSRLYLKLFYCESNLKKYFGKVLQGMNDKGVYRTVRG